MSDENFRVGQLLTPSFEGMEAREIVNNLEGVYYAVDEREYTRSLTTSEINEKMTELAEARIKVRQLEEEKKTMTKEFNDRLSIPKKEEDDLLDAIKFKSERKFGKLYMFDNQESGMMGFFDENGVCVELRSLKQSEKQTKMRQLNVDNG